MIKNYQFEAKSRTRLINGPNPYQNDILTADAYQVRVVRAHVMCNSFVKPNYRGPTFVNTKSYLTPYLPGVGLP